MKAEKGTNPADLQTRQSGTTTEEATHGGTKANPIHLSTRAREEPKPTRPTKVDSVDLVTPSNSNKNKMYTAPKGFYDERSHDQKQEWIANYELTIQRKMPGSFTPDKEEAETAREVAQALAGIPSRNPKTIATPEYRLNDPNDSENRDRNSSSKPNVPQPDHQDQRGNYLRMRMTRTRRTA